MKKRGVLQGEVKFIGGRRVATPEYRSWQMMKNRCRNPKAHDWKYYGGRGIRISAEWCASFEAFLRDMGRRPTPKHTLERLDSGGNYHAGNCVWATRAEQARNRDYVKLSLADAAVIRQRYFAGGVRQVDLAKEYNVTQATISVITRGAGWKP